MSELVAIETEFRNRLSEYFKSQNPPSPLTLAELDELGYRFSYLKFSQWIQPYLDAGFAQISGPTDAGEITHQNHPDIKLKFAQNEIEIEFEFEYDIDWSELKNIIDYGEEIYSECVATVKLVGVNEETYIDFDIKKPESLWNELKGLKYYQTRATILYANLHYKIDRDEIESEHLSSDNPSHNIEKVEEFPERNLLELVGVRLP